jgi:peptide/nickel transport system permease protein
MNSDLIAAIAPQSAHAPAEPGGRYFPGGLGGFIVRRVALGLLTLAGVSVLVFFATMALPGDPATAILGLTTPERIHALRLELGLDKPLLTQYLDYVRGIVSGNLGRSLAYQEPVSSYLSGRLVMSAVLVALSAGITLPLSIALGVATAARRDGVVDRTVLFSSLVAGALPEFVTGVLLVIVFVTTVFHVLPAISLIPAGAGVLAEPKMFVLPVITLVLAAVPYLYRQVRAVMIDTLESDYVEMAMLKGAPRRTLLYRHALRNSLTPVLQASSLCLAFLVGGTVPVEFLFNYPGLGSALTSAVANRDLSVIQAICGLYAACYIMFNLIADVLTVFLTPRLRTRL